MEELGGLFSANMWLLFISFIGKFRNNCQQKQTKESVRINLTPSFQF